MGEQLAKTEEVTETAQHSQKSSNIWVKIFISAFKGAKTEDIVENAQHYTISLKLLHRKVQRIICESCLPQTSQQSTTKNINKPIKLHVLMFLS
jgi:hypothetical protein